MRKSKYLMERITQRAAGGGSAADQPEGMDFRGRAEFFRDFLKMYER